MGSMSCLDPLAFLLVSPKQVNPCSTAWQHLFCPVKGRLGPRGWDMNRVSFSILLRSITGAKICYVMVLLMLKPNKPAINWRLDISDIDITSILI